MLINTVAGSLPMLVTVNFVLPCIPAYAVVLPLLSLVMRMSG